MFGVGWDWLLRVATFGLLVFAVLIYVFQEYTADASRRARIVAGAGALYVFALVLWAGRNLGAEFTDWNWVFPPLLGTSLGIGFVIVNFGERPASARSCERIIGWILFGTTAGIAVDTVSRRFPWSWPHPDWMAVAAIGAVVGIGELVSRYRDEPTRAVFTLPAILYVSLNSSAAMIALGLMGVLGYTVGGQSTGTYDFVNWPEVLAAGLGAMAVLRSALFIVRTNGQDLQVGPGSLIQTLLDAADRSLDRLRAQERAWTVARVMERFEVLKPQTLGSAPTVTVMGPLTFARGTSSDASVAREVDRRAFELVVADAAASLPRYIIALTQNLKEEERRKFLKEVEELGTNPTAAMSHQVRLYNVGLIAMNFVGSKVLDAAVTSLAEDMKTRAREKVAELVESAKQTEEDAKRSAGASKQAHETAIEEGASPAVIEATSGAVEASDTVEQSAATMRTQANQLASDLGASKVDLVQPAQLQSTPGGPVPGAPEETVADASGQLLDSPSRSDDTTQAGGTATEPALSTEQQSESTALMEQRHLPKQQTAVWIEIVDAAPVDSMPWLLLHFSTGLTGTMSGWRLKVGTREISIPASTEVQGRQSVTLHVGEGQSSEGRLFLGSEGLAVASDVSPGTRILLLDTTGELLAETVIPAAEDNIQSSSDPIY